MSITLKFKHMDGLRVRQQSAQKVERTGVDNLITKGFDWKFDPLDIGQDEDPRRRDNQGKPTKLGTYTVCITTNLKNLVVERKGKVESLDFRNAALRNQIRIQYQTLVDVRKNKREGDKPQLEWRNSGPATYLLPNTFGGVFIGDGQRAVIDEMPT
jgi:hypothetical protein